MENYEKKYENNIVCFAKNENSKWDPKIYNDYCKKYF